MDATNPGNADLSGQPLSRAIRQDIRDSALTRLQDLAKLDAVDQEAEDITKDADAQETTVVPRQPTEAEVEAQASAFIGSEDDNDHDLARSPITDNKPSSDGLAGRRLASRDRPPPPKRIRSDNVQPQLQADERMTTKGWIKKITPDKRSHQKN